MTFELTVLALSVVLLFVHIGVQGIALTRERGHEFNAGPRDDQRPLGIAAGRAQRALRNFLETWPAFIALALMVTVADKSGGLTQWGAGLYLAFRIVYLPLYLGGVSYVRSLAFGLASLGLLMMLAGVLIP